MVDWSRHEVEISVADYFEKFDAEQRGETYNKAEHRRTLQQHLDNRTEAAIELKHQNIRTRVCHTSTATSPEEIIRPCWLSS